MGKSTVSAQLSFGFSARSMDVGLLDVDICGPSVPRMLGLLGLRVGSVLEAVNSYGWAVWHPGPSNGFHSFDTTGRWTTAIRILGRCKPTTWRVSHLKKKRYIVTKGYSSQRDGARRTVYNSPQYSL